MTRRDLGYVYIMGGDGGPLKIGQSTNVPLRLKTLSWYLKRRLTVMFWLAMPSEDLLSVEKLAHYLLRDGALGHELFDVSFEAAKDAVCDARMSFLDGKPAPKATDDPARELVSLSVKLPADLISRLTDWRARQDRIPNRAESIRRLILIGLGEAEAGPDGTA